MPIEMTPRLIDLILGFVALELAAGAGLLVRAAATRWIAPLFLFLVSGAALLVALRAALASDGQVWIAAALLVSLATHSAALFSVYRLRREG